MHDGSLTAAEPGGIAGWAVDLMATLGGPGVGLAVALENLFPPLPSEVFLPLAGFTASMGRMTLPEVLAWTTAGSVAGAIVLYLLGALLGPERVRAIVARVPLMDVSDVDKTQDWFARHGNKAVFFGRLIPFFRSLISIPAGVERMPLPVFLLCTALGSLIWNTALVLAGYLLGESWTVVEAYVGVLSKVVLGLVVLAVVLFVVKRTTRLRRERRSEEAGRPS
ncbi:DedA family protein [Nonomuraea zeae]|uniref:DedA family protein n=1 Tax=Nonomuraea zeae TaxID=1642303 RepID=A0A5S4G0C4_9ACTN|nr:DedA family protein [Nonomuraea zeae]TMR25821.1 DedA family protein [Nonomuraea zeae]